MVRIAGEYNEDQSRVDSFDDDETAAIEYQKWSEQGKKHDNEPTRKEESLLKRFAEAGIAGICFTVIVFIIMAAIGFAFGVGWIAAEGLLK